MVHHPLAYEDMRDRLAAVILPDFAAKPAAMDRAIAEGAEDRTTDTVQRLTVRPPNPFRVVAERELQAAPETGPTR